LKEALEGTQFPFSRHGVQQRKLFSVDLLSRSLQYNVAVGSWSHYTDGRERMV